MNNINKQLETINEILDRIDVKQKAINDKLDEVIAALHAYDDDNIYSGYDEPNVALLKAAGLYNERVAPCRGHDAASWDEERMDIIGQNGNEGLHYDVEDAFNDYGERVGKDNDNNNTQTKPVGEKKRSKRKYYKPKPKSAIVEHQKYPPHKH